MNVRGGEMKSAPDVDVEWKRPGVLDVGASLVDVRLHEVELNQQREIGERIPPAMTHVAQNDGDSVLVTFVKVVRDGWGTSGATRFAGTNVFFKDRMNLRTVRKAWSEPF